MGGGRMSIGEILVIIIIAVIVNMVIADRKDRENRK